MLKNAGLQTGATAVLLLAMGGAACSDTYTVIDNRLKDDNVLTGSGGTASAGAGGSGGSGMLVPDGGTAAGGTTSSHELDADAGPDGGDAAAASAGGTANNGGSAGTGGNAGTGGGGNEPTNLIANPDFETNLDGWTAEFGGTLELSTAQAHGGFQSARVTARSDTYQGAHYDVTGIVQMGATYSVRAFARLGGADSDNLILTTARDCDGSDRTYHTIASGTGTDAAWLELSGEMVVPPADECTLVKLLVYVEGPAPGVDIYVDDVSMEPSAPAP